MKNLFLIIFTLVSVNLSANNFEKIPKEFQETCRRIQREYDIPIELLYAVPFVESSWNPDAVSYADCIGLMQLNPVYEDYFVEKFWRYPSVEFDIYNPYHNLELGFAYLAYLKDRFNTWEFGLYAYNCGPTRTAKLEIPNESISYYTRIVIVSNED